KAFFVPSLSCLPVTDPDRVLTRTSDPGLFLNDLWWDQTVFIVGGGPSLKSFDFDLLRGRHVLAINAAGYDVPWADLLYFQDYHWMQQNLPLIRNWAGTVASTSTAARDAEP